RPSTAGPPSWRAEVETTLPPDPFFSGPGLDRADALRADDSALAEMAARPDALELRWRDGLPDLTDSGKLSWGLPTSSELFLGLDGDAPRFSPIVDVSTDFRAALPLIAT